MVITSIHNLYYPVFQKLHKRCLSEVVVEEGVEVEVVDSTEVEVAEEGEDTVEDSVDEVVVVDSVAAEEVASDSRTMVLLNTLLVRCYWPS